MNRRLRLLSVVLVSAFVAALAFVYFGFRGFEEGSRSLGAMPSARIGSVREIAAHRDGQSVRVLAIPAGSV
jgi:hypothetical protein